MKREPEEIPEEVMIMLAPFFPEFELDRVRVFEGIPFYILGNPIGYADRFRIYFEQGAYRTDTVEGVSLLAHEITHCRQYHVHGTWRFRLLYLLYYFNNLVRGMSRREAYLNVPFEIEAREIEAKVYLALRRIQERIVSPQ